MVTVLVVMHLTKFLCYLVFDTVIVLSAYTGLFSIVNDCLMSSCHLWLMSSVLPTNSMTNFEKADDSSLRRLFGESYSSILPVVQNIVLVRFNSYPRRK